MLKGYVDDPSDLCVCDISGMDFTEVSHFNIFPPAFQGLLCVFLQVKSAELSSFDSLIYLCASDNQLSLGQT